MNVVVDAREYEKMIPTRRKCSMLRVYYVTATVLSKSIALDHLILSATAVI